ncbi:hypothetical protein skT53_33830 [Effusibacillus dendaii]|uniref:Uncharacterized protein n=1 Tax=Effusibacillus dendaii TaxID=2743772 RepID=A0A7I8DDX2_9BACL|nr:hypothetical protein skT53_33830 [Effusibacillus dendaii]
MKIMKIIAQIAFLYAVSFVGDWLHNLLHLPIPGSIIGFFLLLVALVVILVCFQIPYSTYMIGGQWSNLLLGPSVVSLAYPLYKQRNILIKNLLPVLGGFLHWPLYLS